MYIANSITRDWYEIRGCLDEYYRLYVCPNCVHNWACAGISKPGVRSQCKDYSPVRNRYSKTKLSGNEQRTIMERMRDGE